MWTIENYFLLIRFCRLFDIFRSFFLAVVDLVWRVCSIPEIKITTFLLYICSKPTKWFFFSYKIWAYFIWKKKKRCSFLFILLTGKSINALCLPHTYLKYLLFIHLKKRTNLTKNDAKIEMNLRKKSINSTW